jgi:hypothetical protein
LTFQAILNQNPSGFPCDLPFSRIKKYLKAYLHCVNRFPWLSFCAHGLVNIKNFERTVSMVLKKELQMAYGLAIVLFIVGVISYAAFPAKTPDRPVRLMFQSIAGNVLFDPYSGLRLWPFLPRLPPYPGRRRNRGVGLYRVPRTAKRRPQYAQTVGCVSPAVYGLPQAD